LGKIQQIVTFFAVTLATTPEYQLKRHMQLYEYHAINFVEYM